jgi:hypothetical protein
MWTAISFTSDHPDNMHMLKLLRRYGASITDPPDMAFETIRCRNLPALQFLALHGLDLTQKMQNGVGREPPNTLLEETIK